MRRVSDAINTIIDHYKRQARYEVREGGISTNRPWINAAGGKRPKRDAPEHLPIEGREPETTAATTRRQLSNIADVIVARTAFMEQALPFEERGEAVPVKSQEYETRRKAVLTERDIRPIEIAYLYGYTSDRPVRELRARNGLDETTGRPLRDDQRPLVSPNLKRQRKVRGKR